MLITFILAFIAFKIERTIIGPATVFFSTWFISIVCFSLDIFKFYPAQGLLLILLGSSFVLFFFGFLSSNILFKKPLRQDSSNFYQQTVYERKTIDLFFYIFVFLLGLRFLSTLFELLIRYGSISAIISSGGDIYNLSRHEGIGAGIPVLIPVEALVTFFGMLRFVRAGIFDRLTRVSIFMILGLIFLNQSRSTLLACLLTSLAPLMVYSGNLKIFTLKRIVVLILAILVITVTRDIEIRGSRDSVLSDFEYIGQLGSLVFYLGGGVAGLNEYLRIGVDEYSGLYSFNGLLLVFETLTLQSNLGFRYDPVTYYTPYSTIIATAFRYLFDDFGWATPLIMFFLGFFARYCTIRAKTSNFAVLFLSHLYFYLGLTFFVHAPFLMSFWLFVIVSVLVIFLSKSNFLRVIYERRF